HVAAAFTRRGYASRPLSTPETITTDGTAMAGLMLLAPLASSTAFEWAQAAASSLKHGSSKGHALLCTVTRLDGGFGFTGKPVDHPEQGALAGLSKTAALEWDKIRCRAVDLSPDWPDEVAAEALAREIADYHATDDLEIGLSAEGRLTPRMTAEALSESIGPLQLSENDVVVVTGGARGVTAEAVAALARRTRCRLALLGRSPLPESEPDWLAGLQGEAHIKQAILKHDFNGSASSPRALAIACQRRMADRDILATLSGLQQAGLQVAYHAVDVRDAEAVRMTVERIRQEWGAVKAMIHGAGVLADHLLVDKQKHQFIEVYETKISGLASLLSATQQDPLRYVVLFSSIAARTGNPGQCDYAMANEALNKIGTQYALDHPQCKVLAINWGPWDGGMVTPSLKRVLEKRGVDLIPIAQGAAAMVAEMAQPAGGPVEIVIGGPLGMPALTDTQPTAEAVETQAEPAAMTQAAQRDIDATQCPVLQDHQLDGRPVVPFALMAEWLAHGALHANPGLRLHGIDELRLLNGIIFDHHQRRIQLMAGATARIGELFEVAVQIRDANGNGTSRIHSSAKAILADRLPPAPEFHENGHFNPSPNLRPLAEIYETVLFHGETLHGIKEIIRIGEQGITAHLQAAPSPDQWLTEPLRSRWIADPLVLDCAFQMAVIWCHEQRGQVCLPIYAAAYRQYRERFPAEGCTAVLEVIQTDAHKLTADITFLDQARKVIAVMKGYEAVIDQQLFKAFRVKAA
ncbi:MAG: SDR family oxidoreductase, partial [Desulfatitalea sp.]|nr:SDR family oxidoreductase [Desulfatitalea sp.]NNK01377.1 SDR family oxidoreductase [Desulfatitalea sp.]